MAAKIDVLWQGVHAILVADPSVQESVLELLLPHFMQFTQAKAPFVKLDACVNAQVSVYNQAFAAMQGLHALTACCNDSHCNTLHSSGTCSMCCLRTACRQTSIKSLTKLPGTHLCTTVQHI